MQTVLCYQELGDEYNVITTDVAPRMTMYPKMKQLLQQALREPHLHPYVISRGAGTVWQRALIREGLGSVPGMGSGNMANGALFPESAKYKLVGMIKKSLGIATGTSTVALADAYATDIDDEENSKALRIVAFTEDSTSILLLAHPDVDMAF